MDIVESLLDKETPLNFQDLHSEAAEEIAKLREEKQKLALDYISLDDQADEFQQQLAAAELQIKQMKEVIEAALEESPIDRNTLNAAPSTPATTEHLDAYVREAVDESLILHGYTYSVNDTYVVFSCGEPPEDAYDEGSLVPVYARKEKKCGSTTD